MGSICIMDSCCSVLEVIVLLVVELLLGLGISGWHVNRVVLKLRIGVTVLLLGGKNLGHHALPLLTSNLSSNWLLCKSPFLGEFKLRLINLLGGNTDRN